MRFNIGSSSSYSSSSTSNTANTAPAPSSGLPTDHPSIPAPSSSSTSRRPPPACPMHNADSSSSSIPIPPPNPDRPQVSPTFGAKCPIQHDPSQSQSSKRDPDALNPLNSIPLDLSATRQPNQSVDLPTDRTASTIPRPQTQPDDEKVWDYPSPQQFYNALVRKGWETPEESVEVMVAIHNFLNEQAWQEVLKWEKRLPGGDQAQLQRFQGRPGELSPKARFHLWAGKLFPSRFNTTPPFDRHDWIVTRPATASSAAMSTPSPAEGKPSVPTTTTRYVIDYYSAPPDEDGNPVFHLDVRPALDSLESINQRVRVGLEEWMRSQEGQ